MGSGYPLSSLFLFALSSSSLEFCSGIFFSRMFRHPFSPDCLVPYITVIWVFYFTYTFYLQHFLYIHPLSPDFTHCFSRDLGTLFTRQSHTLISHLKKATKGACCIYCLIKEVFFFFILYSMSS